MPGLKAKLARAFLNFLDEHGGYRSQLEEAAVRAAAAEANFLWAKDRRGRKKRRRRGGRPKEDEEGSYEEEDYLDELAGPSTQLPEDPYEQIQFYFNTFTHRTKLQIEERIDLYRMLTKNWAHDELHHPTRVPVLSGGMLAAALLLWACRTRSKKIGSLARIHGILGKKLQLSDYLHANVIRGKIMLQCTDKGMEALDKLAEKANKAEDAALASMRPYQRKKYERFCRMEKVGEQVVTACLILGLLASGLTMVLSLSCLMHGDHRMVETNGTFPEGEQLDGYIYSLDVPTDLDGYPMGMRELAEENFAACLLAAEAQGIDNPSTVCDAESFFDAAAAELSGGANYTSPLRSKIRGFLTSRLYLSAASAGYLTSLRTQTIAYLSSILLFLVLLVSHYIAHKIHIAAVHNDPMKHFVLSATDKSIKADGTVAAKKGETEAQRKRRERMLQAERMKARMSQLAMEAKQRVEERRRRLEGEAAAEKEKEEEQKKMAEEQEEIVKCHSKQFMMLKCGVPEGAIINSLIAEGMDDDEVKEVVEKLKAIKASRAEEAQKNADEEAEKAEMLKKAEKEKELIAQERLRMMKSQKCHKRNVSVGEGSLGNLSAKSKGESSLKLSEGEEPKKNLEQLKTRDSTPAGSVASTITSATDPSAAKGAILGQIGQINLTPASERKPSKKLLYGTSRRPGSSTIILAGNMPVGAKTDTQWDEGNKACVDAATRITPPNSKGTPKKSNVSGDEDPALEAMRKIPSKLKLGCGDKDEGLDQENNMEEKVDLVRKPTSMVSLGSGEEKRKGEKDPKMAADATQNMPSLTVVEAGSDEVTKGESKPLASDGVVCKAPTNLCVESGRGEDDSDVSKTKRKMPGRLTFAREEWEEKKGDEDLPAKQEDFRGSDAARGAREIISPAAGIRTETTSFVTSAPTGTPTNMEVHEQMVPPEAEGNCISSNAQSSTLSPIVLVRISNSPNDAKEGMLEESLQSAPEASLDPFARRVSATEIRACIEEVENASSKEDGHEENDDSNKVDLSPGWLHSPAFEMALRNSNASWDRRPSSRDIMGRIEAIEQYERQAEEMEQCKQIQDEMERKEKEKQARQRVLSQREDSLGTIDECQLKIETANCFELGRKLNKFGGTETEDDEISELSEPTFVSNDERPRSLPRSLVVPSAPDTIPMSPMVMSVASAFSPSGRKSLVAKENMERLVRLAEGGELDIPTSPVLEDINEREVVAGKTGNGEEVACIPPPPELETPKFETEEERKRNERAEARAKKIQAIAARRNAGEDFDDDESAVSGLSKRRSRMRRRKKKAAEGMVANMEDNLIKSDAISQISDNTPIRVESEGEKRRKKRAQARAKKLEAMAARRNEGKPEVGEDDMSIVSGITKRHRIRRKKSMLSAISPEERERIEWKRKIFESVLTAERSHWRKCVYIHVIKAEQNHIECVKAKHKLEEQNTNVRRRMENRRRARKFAARAERFHKIRRGGADGEDDASSVVSSASRMRRRRGRKNTSQRSSVAPVEELPLTAQEEDQQEREGWCRGVYACVMHANQSQWKRIVYCHALGAESAREKRFELEVQVEKERAAAEMRREKERRHKERAKKMERMHKIRRDGGDDESIVSSASRMRRRRGRRSNLRGKASSVSAPMKEIPQIAPTEVKVTLPMPTAEEREIQEREAWCRRIQAYVIQADRSRWRKLIFNKVFNAEEEQMKRLEVEARIEKERAAAELRREKERQNNLRMKKIEVFKQSRGKENETALDDDLSVVSAAKGSGVSSMKKMRDRRRKAAKKKALKD